MGLQGRYKPATATQEPLAGAHLQEVRLKGFLGLTQEQTCGGRLVSQAFRLLRGGHGTEAPRPGEGAPGGGRALPMVGAAAYSQRV